MQGCYQWVGGALSAEVPARVSAGATVACRPWEGRGGAGGLEAVSGWGLRGGGRTSKLGRLRRPLASSALRPAGSEVFREEGTRRSQGVGRKPASRAHPLGQSAPPASPRDF